MADPKKQSQLAAALADRPPPGIPKKDAQDFEKGATASGIQPDAWMTNLKNAFGSGKKDKN